jgi:outer membrane protein assembly factor BamB
MDYRLLLSLILWVALLALGPLVLTAEDQSLPAGRNWPMYGGSPSRNMVNTVTKGIPTDWGNKAGGKNVRWVADLGSRGYLPPAIADGKVFIPTNNRNPRDPKVKGDKAVLLCFQEDTGAFLWQIVHDMPPLEVVTQAMPEGLLSTPAVEGDRLYYVTPAAQVVCASTTGMVLWTCDLMKDYKVYPCYVSYCSPLVVGDRIYVVTGNGRGGGESDKSVPEPKAPSFVALSKKEGKVVWQDSSPGENVMEGSWGSPAYAEVQGKGQVIFPGGDGWLYAFAPCNGRLLWKFDCNPKGSEVRPGGRGTRGYLLAPVVYDSRVYTAVGQQPDNGPGVGHLWCVDLTRTGDVSEELEKGKPNPNSALAWHYGGAAPPGAARDWLFGRSISGCAIHDGLLHVAEGDGLLHCLDARTGQKYWEEDFHVNVWASPLWVDGKVYLADDSGDVHIVAHGKEKKVLPAVDMGIGVKAPAVVANGVLYITTERRLFAIAKK